MAHGAGAMPGASAFAFTSKSLIGKIVLWDAQNTHPQNFQIGRLS
jgi:hypothetical protein